MQHTAAMLVPTLALALIVAPEAPASSFDHSAYDALLERHVSDGLVDYDSFGAEPDFRAYLDDLARARPADLDAEARLAFWLNAYNAYAIDLVTQTGERDSIRNLGEGGDDELKGPFSRPIARVAGGTLSLDQIEHEVIRREFREPRIHFALVCAARGCPPLREEAYVGARLNAQLDDQARRFLLESPGMNRVDAEAGVASLSPIFDWFKDDFGGNDAALGRFLAPFFPPGPERRLLESGRFELQHTGYDWSLNHRVGLSIPPFKVYEGMLRFAEGGEADKVRRSVALLGPVLTEHLDALGSLERQRILDLLSRDDRDSLVQGVRLLVARDVVVLLRGIESVRSARAQTLARTAVLQWSLIRPQVAPASAAEVTRILERVVAAVSSGEDDAAARLATQVEAELASLFPTTPGLASR